MAGAVVALEAEMVAEGEAETVVGEEGVAGVAEVA